MLRRALLPIAIVLPACTGPVRTADEPPPPSAVRELARLRATGQLTDDRIDCAVRAVAGVVDEARVRLPELRRQRAEERAYEMQQHARSVSAAQRESERTTAGMLAAIEMRRTAIAMHRSGRHTQAAMLSAQAGAVLQWSVADRAVRIGPAVVVPLLSDDEADLLAEYAQLRISFAGDLLGDDAVTARLRGIESELLEVDEHWATLFLQVYGDPELSCARAGPS